MTATTTQIIKRTSIVKNEVQAQDESAENALQAKEYSGTCSLGSEVIRVNPRWQPEMRLGYLAIGLQLAAMIGITEPSRWLQWEWALVLVFILMSVVVPFALKPRTMIFCDHGLAMVPAIGKPVLIPYASMVSCGGGIILTNERAWYYGNHYANSEEIERCFQAASTLARSHGRYRIDAQALGMLVALFTPLVIYSVLD